MLDVLVSRRNRTLTNDELMQLAWPGRRVTEDSIVPCIYDIRRVVGVDASREIHRCRPQPLRRSRIFGRSFGELLTFDTLLYHGQPCEVAAAKCIGQGDEIHAESI